MKVLKLVTNTAYGKTAQSIGDDPPFQSWTRRLGSLGRNDNGREMASTESRVTRLRAEALAPLKRATLVANDNAIVVTPALKAA